VRPRDSILTIIPDRTLFMFLISSSRSTLKLKLLLSFVYLYYIIVKNYNPKFQYFILFLKRISWKDKKEIDTNL